ncbi:MAG: Veg family protein [Bacillota bacterium]|nr:Veg protein [Bacillota bacterium]HOB91468.1 Veg family protein [Bacillota bacterium]HPZ54877.1 Veg family protein [Bacillota bacterium]HQD17672.1 Veg family protein [Bacillota bacterium]
MSARNVLAKIKSDLDEYVGSRVRLTANQGRKKVMRAEGILEKTYPNIFVVRINEDSDNVKRLSYCYADVLTNSVQLTICDDKGETLFKCANY